MVRSDNPSVLKMRYIGRKKEIEKHTLALRITISDKGGFVNGANGGIPEKKSVLKEKKSWNSGERHATIKKI